MVLVHPFLFFILIALGLFIGCLLGFIAGQYIRVSKYRGEALVANVIAADFQRPHHLMNNVTLHAEDGTTQVDHILVTDTGIFIIETKDYQGWIFGNSNERYWIQVIYKKRSRFLNPLRQNFAHVKAIQSLFKLSDEHFHSLAVFTGNAEFKTDLGPQVIKLQHLIAYLDEPRPVLLDERKMAFIIGRIEMKRSQRSLEIDEYHLNYVRSKVRAS